MLSSTLFAPQLFFSLHSVQANKDRASVNFCVGEFLEENWLLHICLSSRAGKLSVLCLDSGNREYKKNSGKGKENEKKKDFFNLKKKQEVEIKV